MGNKTAEIVQERMDGFTFRPHITARAARIKPEEPAHLRLHNEGQFKTLEKTLRDVIGPKDAQGRPVYEGVTAEARPSYNRESHNKSSKQIPSREIQTRPDGWTSYLPDSKVSDLKRAMSDTGSSTESGGDSQQDCSSGETSEEEDETH